MERWVLPLTVLVPLVGAGLTILANRRLAVQRAIALVALAAHVVLSGWLMYLAEIRDVAVTQMGGWPAPIGITLAADRMGAFVLAAASIVLLVVLVYAIGERGAEREHVGFIPVYLVLAAGVSLSLITGDLFNLFVAFEVMLSASYLLLTIGGSVDQARKGATYVVISLLSSVLLLVALAFIYGATGTVNMADLAGRLGELSPGVRLGMVGLLFVVFGTKSAVFPLFFWLPDSYPAAPSPVTAVFAGLLTKVGVVVMIRVATLFLPPEDRPVGLLLTVGALTMVIGGLGAIAQDDVKRILSFHIVSQIGYMIFGLGLFTVSGIAGAVFFVVHQVLVKSTLFLVGGIIEHTEGTGRLSSVGGLIRKMPVVAVLFLLAALNLAGLPPSPGFIGKFSLVTAGFEARAWWATGAAIAASMLTLFSMVKIWAGAFWGDPVEGHVPVREGRPPALMVWSVGALVAVTVVLSVFAGPAVDYCIKGAEDLLERTTYVQEVLP